MRILLKNDSCLSMQVLSSTFFFFFLREKVNQKATFPMIFYSLKKI